MTSTNKLEIIVEIEGIKYFMDTYDDVPVPLNYQISDINDISSRRSSFSLSISVPETSHNRFIFNSISDLSVDLTFFNPNWKSPCSILFNSIPVFVGNLQLKSVDVDINTNETKYSVVVYSENDDFFKKVGDYTLSGPQSNLDFSPYSHTYSVDHITASWFNNWESGYYYPLVDNTGEWDMSDINGSQFIYATISNQWQGTFSKVFITDFLPATYIKTIWDTIFRTAGYRYESEFLNSDSFTNLLMPFSGKILTQNYDFINSKIFRAGLGETQSFSYHNPLYPVPLNLVGILSTASIVKFDDENPPNGDPNGNWDPTLYEYTCNYTPKIERFGGTIDIIIYNGDCYSSEICRLYCMRSKDPLTGVDTPHWADNQLVNYFLNNNIQNGNQPVIPFPNNLGWLTVHTPYIQSNGQTFSYSDPYIFDNDPNAFIWNTNNDQSVSFSIVTTPYGRRLKVSIDYATDYLDNRAPTNGGLILSTLKYTPLYLTEKVKLFINRTSYRLIVPANTHDQPLFDIIPGAFIANNIDTQVIPDQPIDYNTILPTALKQKDFLTSIIKMFNLYIEPSKIKPKTLIIEPRDDYYATGSFKDWTEKLDISKVVQEQVLAETQNKSTLFTYKQDSDFYNTDYEGRLKEIYGQIKYVIDNDFISGQKKIDNIFSPTPMSLLPGSKGLVIPTIFKLNNGRPQKADSYNYRILRKHNDGVVQLADPRDKWEFGDNLYQYYPYIGHFDDPYNPTEDINWGQSYLYYQNTPTNNNLFNKYWKTYMDEISNSNSRLVTAQFYLNAKDISDFKFNDNIYIVINGVGGYYKVNKISNYDPTQIKTTTVELLKTLHISIPILDTTDTPTTTSIHLPGVFTLPNPGVGGSVWTHTKGNIGTVKGTIVSGVFNTIGGKYTLTLGINNANLSGTSILVGINNNDLGGSNKLTIGNDNLLQGLSSNFVMGDFNRTSNGSKQVYILGDRNIGGDSTFIFGDMLSPDEKTFNIQAALVNSANFTSAGRDVVLNPFSYTPVNFISGGRDKVRELGSEVAINIVRAGRDTII